MGQTIQSHAMHFFMLAGPDLLLGFDADPAIRNVAGLIQGNPALALKAIKARAFGQGIIRKLGGKSVHPLFAVPGGVNSAMSLETRDAILNDVDGVMDIIKTGIDMAKQWFDINKGLMTKFASFPSGYMGLVDADGALALYDGIVRLVDSNGKSLVDFAAKDYLDHIGERVENWSYLKFPYYKKNWDIRKDATGSVH